MVTSTELKNKAKLLLEKAKELEQKELMKIAKVTLSFYEKGLINEELKQAIDKIKKI